MSGDSNPLLINNNKLDIKHLPDFVMSIDPLAVTDNWLSGSMEISFFGSSILYLIESIQETLLDSEVLYASGIAWCGFEAIAGVIIGVNGLLKLKNSKRHRVENATWSLMEIANASQLVAINALTIATSLTALASGFGAAGCMWLKCAQNALQLYRAAKKMDTAYLLKDRVIKYQRVVAQLAKLHSHSIMNKAQQTELKELEKLKYRLAKEAEALIKVYQADELVKLSAIDKRRATFEKYRNAFYTTTGNGQPINDSIEQPSATDRKLVEMLKAKQQEKVASRAATLAASISAAVGVTFIAASILFPPLLIPGIGFCVLASIIKFTEVAVKVARNIRAKQQKQEAVKAAIFVEKPKDIAHVPYNERFDKERRTKCRLAYELSKNALTEKNPQHTEAELEKEYYESLLVLDKNNKLDSYLEKALKAYTNKAILDEAYSTENTVDDHYIASLSTHHKKQIIARKSRQDYAFFAKSKVLDNDKNVDVDTTPLLNNYMSITGYAPA